MKIHIYYFFILVLSFVSTFAQSTLLIDRSKENQTPNNPKVEEPKSKPEEKQKTKSPKNDHAGKVLSNGFALTAIFAGNRGLTDGRYALNSVNTSNSTINYTMNNAFGYRGGIGIGFQTRGYGFEIPFTYSVDRFKVPALSSEFGLKVASFEIGINNYFKFIKAKHYIVFGPYVAFDLPPVVLNLHSIGLNLGYGFNFTKRLNLSLRYKFNIKSIISDQDYGQNVAVGMAADGAEYDFRRVSQYNSLQLVLRFDLINTRRWRDPKNNTTSYINNTPTPVVKVAIDYSTYTDANLQQALKEAQNIDDMLLIQKEMDKRKAAVNEFDAYNDSQLKDLLNAAVAKEDFDRAEVIKNEIKNREIIQKNKPVDPNSLEAKTIEELTVLLNAAVAKEDFDKAAEIQEVIKKKKN